MPILADLDDTLFDTTARVQRCMKGEKLDWDCYLSEEYMSLDKPKQDVIGFIKSLNEPVYIASGRIRERQGSTTTSQLESLGLNVKGIYLKPESWKYAKESYWKARVAIWLTAHGVRINHVLDDNPTVLDSIANALKAFNASIPRLWLVNNGIREYNASVNGIGWVRLDVDGDTLASKCSPFGILRIALAGDEYWAYALDCPGASPQSPSSVLIDVLSMRVRFGKREYDWTSPTVDLA
ncbi:hypothetical protein [Vulcanisaeta souniana]|nr:hypothetical protein [Vulcanisaeta souniana]BDR92242.1 hypothetical protein Vsou_13350 [Vulcanisaeta souniana JCM 11219]